MNSGLHTEEWLQPCDLCGSMSFEPVYSSSELHRCRSCGLVQRAHPDSQQKRRNLPGEGSPRIDETLFESALRQLLRRTEDTPRASLLIIGRPHPSVLPLIAGHPGVTTILVRHGDDAGLRDFNIVTASIEAAPFRPEQFDVILSVRSVDSLDSIASFLSSARIWLKPGGLLFAGGANWGSLGRRLLFAKWKRAHRLGQMFVGPSHMKEYATRKGFDLLSGGTRSRLEEVAGIAYESPTPSFLSQASMLPLWMIATLPGLGETWWGMFGKRDYATRPVLRRLEEETERAPGLAAAGYSRYGSVQRECVDVEQ